MNRDNLTKAVPAERARPARHMMPMETTVAFDVYGTMIDTQAITAVLRDYLAGRTASDFAKVWREKLLEYSFRRGLMRQYETFAVCAGQAFSFTCARFNLHLHEDDRERILNAYALLPSYPDVQAALERLRAAGFRLYAFSNGSAEAVSKVLFHAGLGACFLDVVSVDDVRSFKPDPAVYRHFLKRASAAGRSAWLVSGNPFDVIGALSAGMNAAWVKRSADMPFDPWGIEPTLTVHGLDDLAGKLVAPR